MNKVVILLTLVWFAIIQVSCQKMKSTDSVEDQRKYQAQQILDSTVASTAEDTSSDFDSNSSTTSEDLDTVDVFDTAQGILAPSGEDLDTVDVLSELSALADDNEYWTMLDGTEGDLYNFEDTCPCLEPGGGSSVFGLNKGSDQPILYTGSDQDVLASLVFKKIKTGDNAFMLLGQGAYGDTSSIDTFFVRIISRDSSLIQFGPEYSRDFFTTLSALPLFRTVYKPCE